MKIVRFYIGSNLEADLKNGCARQLAEELLNKAFGGFTRINGQGGWIGGNDGFTGTTIIYECWSVMGYKEQIQRISRDLCEIYELKSIPALIISANDCN